jgi:hypothetical protein
LPTIVIEVSYRILERTHMTSNTPHNEAGESPSGQLKTGKRKGLAIGLTAGLLGGAAAGLVLGVPGLSSAAESDSPAAIVQQVDETDDAETAPGGPDARPDHGERLREMLQPLVDDTTITAEQADKVTSHLIENRPERGDRGGKFEHRGEHRRGVSEEVLELLGTDAESFREQIMGGSSLADIAIEAGVDVQQIVDLMVSEASDRLDEAVANGRIDQAEAAEKLAQIEERITAGINGEFPGRPGG